MKFEKELGSLKTFFAKIGKRWLIIACAVLLVGVAVTVNVVILSQRAKDAAAPADGSPVNGSPVSGGETPEDTAVSAGTSDSYFSATLVSRQRTRDEAIEVLQSVIGDAAQEGEAREAALSGLTQMAKDMEAESNIESLVVSKGFAQCVAVVGNGSVSVVVDVDDERLNAAQVAQINTIVYEQTGITPDKIVIIEK